MKSLLIGGGYSGCFEHFAVDAQLLLSRLQLCLRHLYLFPGLGYRSL
ncbi:MAG: hypothetical protein M3256_25395 [Actinomycetota bacterium]|nr:hypothetical protein [Actinomycetota bacterium]